MSDLLAARIGGGAISGTCRSVSRGKRREWRVMVQSAGQGRCKVSRKRGAICAFWQNI